MNDRNNDDFYINIIQKLHVDLKYIDSLSSTSEIRKKISDLINFIDDETLNNRNVFEEIINLKIKETSGTNPELNAQLYILYRNLNQNKIPLQEARRLYKIYLKEYESGKMS